MRAWRKQSFRANLCKSPFSHNEILVKYTDKTPPRKRYPSSVGCSHMLNRFADQFAQYILCPQTSDRRL